MKKCKVYYVFQASEEPIFHKEQEWGRKEVKIPFCLPIGSSVIAGNQDHDFDLVVEGYEHYWGDGKDEIHINVRVEDFMAFDEPGGNELSHKKKIRLLERNGWKFFS